MPVYDTILECIGRTPLVRLSRVTDGCSATILGKVEMMNPGGSIKDRIGLAMIAAAEQEGLLNPGATLVEATAGNTGVALAMVAAVRGYRCVFVMPEKMSRDKEELLRAYGAEVIRTPNAPPGHPDNFQTVARRLAKEHGWFWPDQFGNAANPDVHYRTTGPEIWTDTKGGVDAFVCGVGTGGTLTGVGRYLKERQPTLKVILADPVGSALGGGESGSYLVEGIGQSIPPANLDATLMDEAIYVSDADAFQMARRLAREEGVLVGGAAGCATVAAIRYGMRPENAGKTIVVLLPDTGRNYLSKIYNDDWMQANGFESDTVLSRGAIHAD
jgi:cystathionine beta-synthase